MTDRELLEKILAKQEETYQIVKALEHKADINKAEHDNMFNKIAHIEGHLKSIDESVDVMKDVIGHHQIDIEILKRRPV